MPDMVSGFGTREFGRPDVLPDGSYVTTKFVVLLFIPVWPLETRRIRYRVKKLIDRVEISRYILKRLPLCWTQVLKVAAAAWALFLAGLFLLMFVVAFGATL